MKLLKLLVTLLLLASPVLAHPHKNRLGNDYEQAQLEDVNLELLLQVQRLRRQAAIYKRRLARDVRYSGRKPFFGYGVSPVGRLHAPSSPFYYAGDSLVPYAAYAGRDIIS